MRQASSASAAGNAAGWRIAHSASACTRRRAEARAITSSAALERAPSSQYGVMSPAITGSFVPCFRSNSANIASAVLMTSRGEANCSFHAFTASGSDGSTGPLSPPIVYRTCTMSQG